MIPLGDIREKRSLIVSLTALVSLALLSMALSVNPTMLALSTFLVGLITIIPQLLVPFTAQLALPEERGKMVGFVMGGLLTGILLSRTFSGLIGGMWGWRTVYFIAAAVMLIFSVLLRMALPVCPPASTLSYKDLLLSLGGIWKSEPVLQQAAVNGAFMFGTFSAFWATLIFLLESPAYHLGPEAAGLIGAFGAMTAPVVGRIADQKSPRFTVGVGIIISMSAYLLFFFLGSHMAALIMGVILLDIGTQTGQVSNQARIFALGDEKRNRINTIFMFMYFIGGSLGSLLGTFAWEHWGWKGTSSVGLLFMLLALLFHLFRPGQGKQQNRPSILIPYYFSENIGK